MTTARRTALYNFYGLAFQVICVACNLLALGYLAIMLIDIVANGWDNLTWTLLSSYPSRFAEKAGLVSAIFGSLWSMILTALISIPMGIGAAIYLEEYERHNTPIIKLIKLNIQNLAGVPSIVYGLLGLTVFVRFFGLGRSVLAGSMTMALLILPIITIAAQEALRAVPESFRQAGFGIGMTRWQVVRYQVMPVALPGMLTGIILALSRAVGEAAPLILVGALTFVAFLPTSPMDSFTVLPIQIYNWVGRPQKEFHEIAASGIIVLLVFLLLMNAISIFLRYKFQRKLKELNN